MFFRTVPRGRPHALALALRGRRPSARTAGAAAARPRRAVLRTGTPGDFATAPGTAPS
ncbi:hypothetical protein DUI70_4252 [Streptomyces albus]|nr:hypothetical protein DUI70_4252 [Streptomyces albus]